MTKSRTTNQYGKNAAFTSVCALELVVLARQSCLFLFCFFLFIKGMLSIKSTAFRQYGFFSVSNLIKSCRMFVLLLLFYYYYYYYYYYYHYYFILVHSHWIDIHYRGLKCDPCYEYGDSYYFLSNKLYLIWPIVENSTPGKVSL